MLLFKVSELCAEIQRMYKLFGTKTEQPQFFFPKIGLCHLYVNIMTKYYARLQKKNELSEQIPRKIVQWLSGIIQPDRHTNENKLNTMKLFGLLKTHKMTVFFNALNFFV